MGIFSTLHWLFHGISSIAARDCWWASVSLPPYQLISSSSPCCPAAGQAWSVKVLSRKKRKCFLYHISDLRDCCSTVKKNKAFAYSSAVWDYISEPHCCLQEIHSFMWQFHVITAPGWSGSCLKSLTTPTGSRCRVRWMKQKLILDVVAHSYTIVHLLVWPWDKDVCLCESQPYTVCADHFWRKIQINIPSTLTLLCT